jgi:hypothetical protein
VWYKGVIVDDDDVSTVVVVWGGVAALVSWRIGVEESMLEMDVEDVLEPTEDVGRTSGRLGGGGVAARMVKTRLVPAY